jgi:hypothetical protein
MWAALIVSVLGIAWVLALGRAIREEDKDVPDDDET